ncbi:MAG: 50S ribosomal protein L10 [Candidatus Hydrothermarchaeota archaeon]|nr:50S ribosomal protein L10 [Candidatus Hydrothermarchaeota archaeon]
MSQVAKWKFAEVDKLAGLLKEYPVIGIANVHGIPAKQMQKMRSLLRGEVLIRMSKKSLMKHSLEKFSKEEKGISELSNHISGQPAFIFSRIDPFKLNKILKKNRATAPAKPDSIAPKDITVKKGETSFPPGPLLSELQQAGIPTTIQEGKIAIKKDTVVVRAGERISPQLAMALSRLGVEPMELGIELLAAYEDGTLFPGEALFIDEEKVFSDFQRGFNQVVSLCLESGYLTRVTAPLVLGKCFNDARALALETGIFEREIMDQLLSKAYLQMLSLASNLEGDVVDEELRSKLSSKAEVKAEAAVEAEPKEAKADPEKKEEKSEDEAMS